MVRKLVELPKFHFSLLLFTLYRFLYMLFELLIMGLVTFLCLRFRWS
jgi:hypothetical protein